MKLFLKKICPIFLAFSFLLGCMIFHPSAEETMPISENSILTSDVGVEDGALKLNCQSAILMEATTGAILYVQNAEEGLPPASVTKIMTLLLVMEAIDGGKLKLTDTVTVSEYAASMGGSQVYLKVGEQMSVNDMLKSVIIASANDAAVALAEHVWGNVDVFVSKMNEKAKKLGMSNTHFENVTGLDDTAQNHLTSAKDIAIMSRELIRHETVLQYSSIWMDTIRNGEFGLTNTNRLVRYYPGCTGLKTGSTSKAGFCISVTARREEMSLICVIMGAESRDIRNASAASLLDWGFANYGLYSAPAGETQPISVAGGLENLCRTEYTAFTCVLPKEEIERVEASVVLPEGKIAAPISKGDILGEVVYQVGEKQIGSVKILAAESVNRIHFFEILKRITAAFTLI